MSEPADVRFQHTWDKLEPRPLRVLNYWVKTWAGGKGDWKELSFNKAAEALTKLHKDPIYRETVSSIVRETLGALELVQKDPMNRSIGFGEPLWIPTPEAEKFLPWAETQYAKVFQSIHEGTIFAFIRASKAEGASGHHATKSKTRIGAGAINEAIRPDVREKLTNDWESFEARCRIKIQEILEDFPKQPSKSIRNLLLKGDLGAASNIFFANQLHDGSFKAAISSGVSASFLDAYRKVSLVALLGSSMEWLSGRSWEAQFFSPDDTSSNTDRVLIGQSLAAFESSGSRIVPQIVPAVATFLKSYEKGLQVYSTFRDGFPPKHVSVYEMLEILKGIEASFSELCYSVGAATAGANESAVDNAGLFGRNMAITNRVEGAISYLDSLAEALRDRVGALQGLSIPIGQDTESRIHFDVLLTAAWNGAGSGDREFLTRCHGMDELLFDGVDRLVKVLEDSGVRAVLQEPLAEHKSSVETFLRRFPSSQIKREFMKLYARSGTSTQGKPAARPNTNLR